MTNIQNAASALTHRTGERTGTSVTGNNVQLLHYGGSGTIIKGYEPALGCLAPTGSLERPTDKTGQLLVQSHDQRGVSIVYTAADGPRVETSRVCFLCAAETQRRSPRVDAGKETKVASFICTKSRDGAGRSLECWTRALWCDGCSSSRLAGAQRQHRRSSAGALLSAQEGKVTFGAFVGVVALLAALDAHKERR